MVGYDQPRDYTKRRIAEVEAIRAQRRWERTCRIDRISEKVKDVAFWAFMVLLLVTITVLGWTVIEDFKANRAQEEAAVLRLKQAEAERAQPTTWAEICADGSVKHTTQYANGARTR